MCSEHSRPITHWWRDLQTASLIFPVQLTSLLVLSLEIGVFEAKARWSQLLDQAESGEEVIITRWGVPVARLVPMPHSDGVVEQALAELTSIRSRATTGPESIRELINEGRHR